MIFHIVIYFIALAGIVVLNIVNNAYVVYVIDMIFAAVSVFSIVTSLIFRFKVNAEFVSENVIAEKGSKCNIRIRIINNSVLPLTNCRVKIVLKSETSRNSVKRIKVMCRAGSSEIFMVAFECSHCELVTADLMKIYPADYLGIFPLIKYIRRSARIIVMPKLPDVSVTDVMFSQINDDENIVYSKNKPGDDPSEIFDIKEYSPGDKIKNIHWKLSAKVNKTMVKENGLPLVVQDTVILDIFNDADIQLREELYELFYGLIYAMTRRGFGFEMRYFNEKYIAKRIENQSDIYALFADIYSIKPLDKKKQAAAEYYAATEVGRGNRLFYLTEKLDDMTLKRLEYLCTDKNVYYLIPGELDNLKLPVKFG